MFRTLCSGSRVRLSSYLWQGDHDRQRGVASQGRIDSLNIWKIDRRWSVARRSPVGSCSLSSAREPFRPSTAPDRELADRRPRRDSAATGYTGKEQANASDYLTKLCCRPNFLWSCSGSKRRDIPRLMLHKDGRYAGEVSRKGRSAFARRKVAEGPRAAIGNRRSLPSRSIIDWPWRRHFVASPHSRIAYVTLLYFIEISSRSTEELSNHVLCHSVILHRATWGTLSIIVV